MREEATFIYDFWKDFWKSVNGRFNVGDLTEIVKMFTCITLTIS